MLPWQVASAWAFAWNTLANFSIGAAPAKWCQRLGLEDNKAVSDAFPTLVTPAGWAFAIWGPIFALEGVFSYWQLSAPAHSSLRLSAPFW